MARHHSSVRDISCSRCNLLQEVTPLQETQSDSFWQKASVLIQVHWDVFIGVNQLDILSLNRSENQCGSEAVCPTANKIKGKPWRKTQQPPFQRENNGYFPFKVFQRWVSFEVRRTMMLTTICSQLWTLWHNTVLLTISGGETASTHSVICANWFFWSYTLTVRKKGSLW